METRLFLLEFTGTIATQQSFFRKLALGNCVQTAGEEWEEDRAQQSV